MATSKTRSDGEEDHHVDPYDTKAIRFHLVERGQYFYVLLTRFRGDETILGEIGYRSEFIQYQTMSMNSALRLSDTDLFALAREHPFPLRDMNAFDLLYALDQGKVSWDAISDGDHLTTADVEALLEAADE